MEAKQRALSSCRASFFVGDEDRCMTTTYGQEYSDNSYTKFNYINNTFTRYPKSLRVVRNPLEPCGPVSTEVMEAVQRSRSNQQRLVQSVKLGYDPMSRDTAYTSLTKDYSYQQPLSPIIHKTEQHVFPDTGLKKKTRRCSYKNSDYSTFGDDIRQKIITGNAKNYNAIVAERCIDSIDNLNTDNSKNLTTSQVTYWHPLQWLRGANKNLLVADIPRLQTENIFNSAKDGEQEPMTQESSMYGWTHARGGIDRFYKPDATCYEYPCPCKKKQYDC